MKKKIVQKLTGILIVTLAAASMAMSGCSQSGNENTETQAVAEGSSEAGTENQSGEASQAEEHTVFGKVTAIEGDAITIALAKMPERGQRPDGEAPDGERPDGEAPGRERPDGEMPAGGGQMELTLTGEEKTVLVKDDTTYTINGEEGTLDDLQVDDIVTIALADDGTAESVRSGMGMGRGGNGQGPKGAPDGSTEGESSSVDTAGANEVTDTQSLDGSLGSDKADESAVVVKDGGALTLTDATITKTGDSSNTESSEFYGLNAALLAKEGSTITISGTDITTDAEGANAIFATGEGAAVTVSNVTIKTTGNSSRGLDATYGGTIYADQVTINTSGAHCAAVATDRGEGTVAVTDSNLQTSGEGSPCVYSTGDITVSDSTGYASGSSLAVVEGKNAITLSNCNFTSAGKGRADGGIDNAGVMVYQSMSGDAGEGTGNFTSKGSTLAIDSDSEQYGESPMFFVTNTDAVIQVSDTKLQFGSGILLNAAGNDGEWGNAGSNGGTVTFQADDQELEGNITADEISTVALNLSFSSFKGAVNAANMAKEITVSLDAESTWELTGDSYVTALTNGDSTCANIISNGYAIYYDASNESNAWLNGETLILEGGGSITKNLTK